jgi:hypothetical protein
MMLHVVWFVVCWLIALAVTCTLLTVYELVIYRCRPRHTTTNDYTVPLIDITREYFI